MPRKNNTNNDTNNDTKDDILIVIVIFYIVSTFAFIYLKNKIQDLNEIERVQIQHQERLFNGVWDDLRENSEDIEFLKVNCVNK